MKAYPKHIDWGKVIATNEIMDGYAMPKYGNKNVFEDDSWIDIIMDDVYDTFYRGVEEEANVAKASEDIKLSIMKDKFLAMVESEKAIVKDYTKLVVTDGMVDYVLEKYENKWKSGDEIAYGNGKLVEDNGKGKEVEHHHLKVNKEDNGKRKVHDIQNIVGSIEVDLARAIKAKQVDDHDDHDLDTLNLENKIKKLEEDFTSKESKGAELKAKEAKKAKEKELKAKKAKEAKEIMLAELKAKKAKKAKNAKEAMLAEVVQISSNEDDDEDPTAPTSTRSIAPTASTSTRSRAPIASTSNAKAGSTAPRGYKKISMTGCVIALFAPNALPPSATRKRKST
ncbi:hypothetical protein Tco_0906399 [Tanacetum coccineum]|uniref:Uncharacterized protein n=1 Tax=Tanacetum coccineum TaxID=301880 RepID=A0ABQ5CMK4_9ASTR